MSRILVTGSRLFDERPVIHNALLHWVHLFQDPVVVQGMAPGADTIAREVAVEFGLKVEDHPADWKQYGRAAGPRRNEEMVRLGADIVLAFRVPNVQSSGTDDCVRRAKKHGLTVVQYFEGVLSL